MTASTPLVFRPSFLQRTVSALLCAGSWVVGIRTLALLFQKLPVLLDVLRQAQAGGESTFWHWTLLVSAIAACLAGGILLLLSVLALLLVEGSQVLVDELGISVDFGGLPNFLARRLGAGRLVWKDISSFGKRHFFFVLEGGASPDGDSPAGVGRPVRLRFLVVDELERLVLLILERSPNLHFHD